MSTISATENELIKKNLPEEVRELIFNYLENDTKKDMPNDFINVVDGIFDFAYEYKLSHYPFYKQYLMIIHGKYDAYSTVESS